MGYIQDFSPDEKKRISRRINFLDENAMKFSDDEDSEESVRNGNLEDKCDVGSEDEPECPDNVVMQSPVKMYGGGRRESRNKYPLDMKIAAISKMQAGKIASIVSADMGLPVGVISQWWLQRNDIRSQYDQQMADERGEDAVEDH